MFGTTNILASALRLKFFLMRGAGIHPNLKLCGQLVDATCFPRHDVVPPSSGGDVVRCSYLDVLGIPLGMQLWSSWNLLNLLGMSLLESRCQSMGPTRTIILSLLAEDKNIPLRPNTFC